MRTKPKTSLQLSYNKLLRYQLIAAEYQRWKQLDIPTTVIHRKYIYPKFFISLPTLYAVINTPIARELQRLETQLNVPSNQIRMDF